MAKKFGMSEKRVEQLRNMPLIQQRIFKSKDGKYLVNQTRISSIKPVNYYEKVLDSDSDDEEDGFF